MATEYGDHQDFRGATFNGPFAAKVEHHAHGPAPTALDALPPRGVGFTGREGELRVLLNVLDPSAAEHPAAVIVAAVSGLGGIGKTALATEAAHEARARGWFPGGTLFVDLHGYDDDPVTADQALQALVRAQGVEPVHIPAAADERAALYRSLLAERAREYGPVLILADNASSSTQVRPLFPGDGARHRLLVTSRDRLPQLGARLVPLDQLTPKEAYDLLDIALRLADPDDSRVAVGAEDASALAACCGHLPLALQIAAALLVVDRAKPIAELVAELVEVRDRLDQLDDGERSLRATFDLSYRRLPPGRARLLRLLALAPGPDVSTEAITALLGTDSVPLRDVEALARAHLVERASGRHRWRLHDLVRVYGVSVVAEDSELVKEADAARKRLLKFYERLADAADNHLRWLPGTPVPECFADRAEALAWLDAERAGLVAAAQWGVEEQHAAAAGRLTSYLIVYLGWRRYFDDWLAVASAGHEAARLSGDRYGEAVALSNLGAALAEVGRDAEAIDTLARACDLFRAVEHREGEADACTNLGIALRRAGRVVEALDTLVRACDLFRAAGDSQGEADAWSNLGNALGDEGRQVEAIDAHARARDLFRAVDDRHSEATAWGNLGMALLSAGRMSEAVTAFVEALEGFRRFEDWYRAGVILGNLASVHERSGRPTEARNAYLQAAEAFTRAEAIAEADQARVGAQSVNDAPPPPTLTP